MKSIALLCLFLFPSAHAARRVEALVQLVPLGSFTAVSTDLRGEYTGAGMVAANRLEVPLASLETGIKLRDEHLRKHLGAPKTASVVLEGLQGKNGSAEGLLTLNGVSRKVPVRYHATKEGLEARFSVNTNDFKLPEVSYMGVGVERVVEVKVQL